GSRRRRLLRSDAALYLDVAGGAQRRRDLLPAFLQAPAQPAPRSDSVSQGCSAHQQERAVRLTPPRHRTDRSHHAGLVNENGLLRARGRAGHPELLRRQAQAPHEKVAGSASSLAANRSFGECRLEEESMTMDRDRSSGLARRAFLGGATAA